MADHTYRVWVEVALPDSMEESAFIVLSSIVVGALHDADVPVKEITITKEM